MTPSSVPSITTQQMREVDRLMIQEYGIVLLQMMENAGRSLARLAAALSGGSADAGVLVLAGNGNNGGGGMTAARHLANMGREVRVLLTAPAEGLADVPAHQAAILGKMGIEIRAAGAMSAGDLQTLFGRARIIIDALIGYGLSGAPRGEAATLISMANGSGRPIVSLDVPSGVDTGSGSVCEPSIKATATLTLALPKTGLATTAARDRMGDLYLADLSVPRRLYRSLGLDVPPLFGERSVIRLTWSADGWTTEEGAGEPSGDA